MKLSTIILSKTDSDALFEMTNNCIKSLVKSESKMELEIILIESNKEYLNSKYIYPDFVKIIIPEKSFNFHQFLNIGIKEATGDFIALCNNDLIFHENWFSEILKVSVKNPEILSFSPIGTSVIKNQSDTFELGYKVMTHIKGWCLVAKIELFNKIGLLDETFNFAYADNDYAMTLKCNNIKHAMVYNSKVDHLERQSSVTEQNLINDKNEYLKHYKIPKYLLKEEYEWVLSSESTLSSFLKFHKKWGNPNLLYRKNKLADVMIKYHFGYCIPYFFKFRM